MTCEQAHPLLHAYIDDELDLSHAMAIDEHVANCPKCRNELAAARALHGALAQSAPYFPAPSELRERLKKSLRSEYSKIKSPSDSVFFMPWWKRPVVLSGLAAAVVLMVGAAVMFLPSISSRGQVAELVASHVRSLEANHLMDVESTDQHTVKPWFEGKLEFSPPVVDLANDGFPLIGGRLDYLQQGKVAALIYRRNKHLINLFIWPGNAPADVESKQGFNLIRFQSNGMVCWAVSDLNMSELQQFADLFKSPRPASTHP